MTSLLEDGQNHTVTSVSPSFSFKIEKVIASVYYGDLSNQLTRICYLCHAAAAVSDKEVFPIAPLKSGMTYHFRPDSPLHSTTLSTT